jgi:hypothetical protein
MAPSRNLQQTGSVPIPDPTVLTTQQLTRAIEGSRELVETRVVGIKEAIEARLNGYDEGIKLLERLFQTALAPFNDAIKHIDELHNVKFLSIDKQFLERDARTESKQKDDKVAIDAALKAAKEMVDAQNKSNADAMDKSEKNTIKAIEQLQALLASMQTSLNDKIDDGKTRAGTLETRIQGLESSRRGAGEAIDSSRTDHRDMWGIVFGALGVLVAIAAILYRH